MQSPKHLSEKCVPPTPMYSSLGLYYAAACQHIASGAKGNPQNERPHRRTTVPHRRFFLCTIAMRPSPFLRARTPWRRGMIVPVVDMQRAPSG